MTTITKLGPGHYRYRNGEPATVLTVERPRGQPVISMAQNGTLNFHSHDGRVIGLTCPHEFDLLPIPRKVWVNVPRNLVQYPSKDAADKAEANMGSGGRIACVEIELPEGET